MKNFFSITIFSLFMFQSLQAQWVEKVPVYAPNNEAERNASMARFMVPTPTTLVKMFAFSEDSVLLHLVNVSSFLGSAYTHHYFVKSTNSLASFSLIDSARAVDIAGNYLIPLSMDSILFLRSLMQLSPGFTYPLNMRITTNGSKPNDSLPLNLIYAHCSRNGNGFGLKSPIGGFNNSFRRYDSLVLFENFGANQYAITNLDSNWILPQFPNFNTYNAQRQWPINKLNDTTVLIAFMYAPKTGLPPDSSYHTKIYQWQNGNFNFKFELKDTVPLMGMSFTDIDTGFCISYSGLYRTVDGGQSWTLMNAEVQNGTTATQGLISMRFVDSQTGYISYYYGQVFKTIDGGASWFPQDIQGSFFEPLSKDVLFVYGWGSNVWFTNEGGNPSTIGKLDESGITKHLYCYPNPTQHEFYIGSDRSSPVNVSVLDAQGKLVIQQQISNASVPQPLNISGLAAGVYFLRMEQLGQVQSERVIKVD